LHHPEFIPTVPGWQNCWVDWKSEKRNFYLTLKMETKDANHYSEEKDLYRTKPDGRNIPDVELRAHALVRPFSLNTWLAQVSGDAPPIMVRIGILVFPDIVEFKNYSGINLDRFADFDVGQGRKYAGTIAVKCQFKHALQERCGEGNNPEAATPGTTALTQTLRDGIAFPQLYSGRHRLWPMLPQSSWALPKRNGLHLPGGPSLGKVASGRALDKHPVPKETGQGLAVLTPTP
jgi:hypothetical protein